MNALLKNILDKFEEQIRSINAVRHAGPFRQLKVRVLGQQGLLIRRDALKGIQLIATQDFYGLLNGEPPLEDLFKKILHQEGLTYDEDSPYIWLPNECTYEVIYESEIVEVDSPLPIYLIVSKAVKAPEKNKQLVVQAINVFGDDLLELLEKYGVDANTFFKDIHE